MSPEQARGEALDARTDLFSFGAVLYEMATGRTAFPGNTVAVIHDAILNRAPIPPARVDPEIPLKLEDVIVKALEKDRKLRYQHASEIRTDLQRLKRDMESSRVASPATSALSPTAPKTSRRRSRLFYGIAAVTLVAAIGFGLRWFANRRVTHSGPLTESLLTHNPTENRLVAGSISPDHHYFAYADTRGMHLSTVETGEVHDIALPAELQSGITSVDWTGDGQNLLFILDKVVWSVSVFGGPPRKIRTDVSHLAVSPRDSSLAFLANGGHEVWVTGVTGEDPRKVLSSSGKDLYAGLAWSPSGERLAYLTVPPDAFLGGTIATVSTNGGESKRAIVDDQLATCEPHPLIWLPDGRVIYCSSEVAGTDVVNLWAIRTDQWSGKILGAPERLTNWVGYVPTSLSISNDGTRLAVLKTHSRDDVYVSDLKDDGRHLDSPRRLTESDSHDFSSGWTSDSKAIYFFSNRTGRNQIYRQQLDQDTPELVVQSPDDETYAEPSPDAAWILYWSAPHASFSPWRLMRFPVAGGAAELILSTAGKDLGAFDCPSHPAAHCLLTSWQQGELIFYELDPVHGKGRKILATKLGASTDLNWAISPDGLHIALVSPSFLPERVRILDVRNGAEREFHVPHFYTGWPCWSADGKALFATALQSSDHLIIRIEMDGTAGVLLDRGRTQVVNGVSASPDGRHLAFGGTTFEANAWLLQNF